MTTIRLPAEPRPLPAVTAVPGSIEECGAQLRAASAQIDDLGTFVAGTARIEDWSGGAAASYRAGIRPVGRGADAMSLALRGVAHRVSAHADEMTMLDQRHVDLDELRASLVGGIATLRADIQRASAEDVGVLQARADNVAASVAGYERDRAAWITRLGVEEERMIAAFTRVLDLEQVERRYGGLPDPADDALDDKPAPGSPPEQVNAWWEGLTPEQQRAVVAASPGSIGNLDGIPADARHEANTVSLDRDLAEWRSLEEQDLLTDDEVLWLRNAEAADDARDTIGGEFDPVTREPIPTRIHLYDPAAFGGDGRVAIAAGDLGTADNVSILVPGFGTDAASVGSLADQAVTVYESTRTLDPSQTSATMIWIGYDAPDNLPVVDGWGGDAGGVVGEGMAERGGERLADTVDGLRAGRDGDPAHLTVVGHSYGSTTVGHGDGLAVDDLVFVGSPGVGGDVDTAGDTGLDPDHVWAGANSRDPVAILGNHGMVHLETFGGVGLGDDPVEDDFGGNRFQAESTDRGFDLTDAGAEHQEYFDHDTESLSNISHVINGSYDDVVEAAPIHDPWFGDPDDPEWDREPTAPTTLGQP